MKKFVSALFIIPALGFTAAQAATIPISAATEMNASGCQAFQGRGSLAVLTDPQGVHHFRVNYSTNSYEIYSSNSQIQDEMIKALGKNIYIEGCRESDGRVMVTKIVVLENGQGDQGQCDQGQGDQGQSGQDQGQGDQGQSDQGQQQCGHHQHHCGS